MNWTWFHKLASPPHAYRIAGSLAPWFGWPAFLLIVAGSMADSRSPPADYQQGDAFRIVYVHAPSAWLSMFIYRNDGGCGAIGLVWRIKLAHAVASPPPGRRVIHLLALATGAIWGKPMWGHMVGVGTRA